MNWIMAGYTTEQLLEWYLQEHDYERDLQYRMIKTLERELQAMNKD
jgi:hypothetical protein